MYIDCIANKGIIKFSLSNNVPKVNININVECPNERLSKKNIKNFLYLSKENTFNLLNLIIFFFNINII